MRYQIENGSLTTLHPWLGYQNLVDGSVTSYSSPGFIWKDYALGRSSVSSLIQKDNSNERNRSCFAKFKG